MKGEYRTKEGSKVEVLNFDEVNKIAYATINGESKWYPESDYSTWEKEGEESITIEELASDYLNEPEENIQEEV